MYNEIEDITFEDQPILPEEYENGGCFYTETIIKPNKSHSFLKYTVAVITGMFAGAMIFASAVHYTNSAPRLSQNFYPQTEDFRTVSEDSAYTDPSSLSVVDIAKKTGPAVVGINSTRTGYTFFGTKATETGSGSGIVVTEDGYIITNAHVIENASDISVILSSSTDEYPAKVIGIDTKTDLAVIKIEASGLPTAELGTSSSLEVGDLAVAIGNPMGQEFAGSVTVGVISALNRSISVDGRQYNLIQTDAAINPGNSGGALINKYGQVIGINSVKITSDGYEGMGFAIPIDEALPIINELMNGGYVKGRPLIGISPRDITQQMSAIYNLPVGVYITGVNQNSCAEKAGLQIGDIIVKADGTVVTTTTELNKVRDTHKAGEEMTLDIVRNGQTITVKVTLDEDKPIN